jgi:hypothetical protein
MLEGDWSYHDGIVVAGSVSRDLYRRGFGYPVVRLVVPLCIGTNGVVILL